MAFWCITWCRKMLRKKRGWSEKVSSCMSVTNTSSPPSILKGTTSAFSSSFQLLGEDFAIFWLQSRLVSNRSNIHLTSKSTLKNACLLILTTIFCSELAAIWSWVQLRRSTLAVFVGVVRVARAPTPRPQTSHSHGGRSHSLNAPHPVEGVRCVWPPLTEIPLCSFFP